MLSHYLIVAWRHLAKQRAFTLVNMLGLASAMAACLFIFIYVHYETHYDTFWPDSAQIYRVVHDRYQNNELSFQSAKAYWGLGHTAKEQLPEVAAATEIFTDVVTVMNEENQIKDIPMFGVEETFPEVFQLTYVGRKSDNPFTDLHSSALSASAAKKLFGTTDAVGKWFKVNENWEFEVTAVFQDLPANTHMPFDLLLSKQTYLWYFANKNRTANRADPKENKNYRALKPVTKWDWSYAGNFTYLRLKPKTDPQAVEAKINQIKGDYLKHITQDGGRIDFHLQALSSIHLNSNRTMEAVPNGDRRSVWAMGILALVILGIAWMNFVNLTLARSLERAKEVGIRKVAGASRRHLLAQYFVEYGLINLLSVALAVVLVILLQPVVWQILGRKPIALTLLLQPGFLAVSGLVFLAGIVISGFYPALIQSGYSSLSLFKPRHKASAYRLDPRKALVICQFTATIILIVGVITIYRQIDFMRSQDLGVNIERTLVTYSPMNMIGSPKRMSALETYKTKVRALPGVEAIATSSALPGKEIAWQRQDIRKATDLPNEKKNYAYAYIDHDFIPTLKLNLIAGRNFSDNAGAETNTVILNESAARQLGYTEPAAAVDAFILLGDKPYQVVGVLKDYHQESLQKEIRPVVYLYGYKWIYDVGYYAIKLNSADVRASVKSIGDIWTQIYPVDHFEYFFLDEAFDKQYQGDRQFGILFTLFTLLALFIAALGLYGLATYSIQKRTKEIGIRKVNGATAREIVLMLTGEFAKWVGVAFVIACPIAFLVMNRWLQNFAYRTELSWITFAIAGIAALLIALVTVFYQAYAAATRNPVAALRYE